MRCLLLGGFLLALVGSGYSRSVPNHCQVPPEDGSCKDSITKWFFHPGKNTCFQFQYTGCGGNGNRFNAFDDCMSTCHPDTEKEAPPAEEAKPEQAEEVKETPAEAKPEQPKEEQPKAEAAEEDEDEDDEDEFDPEAEIPESMKKFMTMEDHVVVDELLSQVNSFRLEAQDSEVEVPEDSEVALEAQPEVPRQEQVPQPQEPQQAKVEPNTKPPTAQEDSEDDDEDEDIDEVIPPEDAFHYSKLNPEEREIVQELLQNVNSMTMEGHDEEVEVPEDEEVQEAPAAEPQQPMPVEPKVAEVKPLAPESTQTKEDEEDEDEDEDDVGRMLEHAQAIGAFNTDSLSIDDKLTVSELLSEVENVLEMKPSEVEEEVPEDYEPEQMQEPIVQDKVAEEPKPVEPKMADKPKEQTPGHDEEDEDDDETVEDPELILEEAAAKGGFRIDQIKGDDRTALDELLAAVPAVYNMEPHDEEVEEEYEDYEEETAPELPRTTPPPIFEAVTEKAATQGAYQAVLNKDSKEEADNTMEEMINQPPMCQLPAAPGPCRARLQRWNYDIEKKDCVAFSYGGCLGNANKFLSHGECMQRCAGFKPIEEPVFGDVTERPNGELERQAEDGLPPPPAPPMPQQMPRHMMRMPNPRELMPEPLRNMPEPQEPEFAQNQQNMVGGTEPEPQPEGTQGKNKARVQIRFLGKGSAGQFLKAIFGNKLLGQRIPILKMFSKPPQPKEEPPREERKEVGPPTLPRMPERMSRPEMFSRPPRPMRPNKFQQMRMMRKHMRFNDLMSKKKSFGKNHNDRKWPQMKIMLQNRVIPKQFISPNIRKDMRMSNYREDNRYQSHSTPKNKFSLLQVFVNKPTAKSESSPSNAHYNSYSPQYNPSRSRGRDGPMSKRFRKNHWEKKQKYKHHKKNEQYNPHDGHHGSMSKRFRKNHWERKQKYKHQQRNKQQNHIHYHMGPPPPPPPPFMHHQMPPHPMPMFPPHMPMEFPPMHPMHPMHMMPRFRPRWWSKGGERRRVVVKYDYEEDPYPATTISAPRDEPETVIETKDSEPDKEQSYACLMPVARGMCKAADAKWFYNKEKGTCEQFYYGGCGGNANRFNSAEECRNTCLIHAPDVETNTEYPEGAIIVTEPVYVADVDAAGSSSEAKKVEPDAPTTPMMETTADPKAEEKVPETEPEKEEKVEMAETTKDEGRVFGLHLRNDTEYFIVIGIMCVVGLAVLILVAVSTAHFCRKVKETKKDKVVEAMLKNHLYADIPHLVYSTPVHGTPPPPISEPPSEKYDERL